MNCISVWVVPRAPVVKALYLSARETGTCAEGLDALWRGFGPHTATREAHCRWQLIAHAPPDHEIGAHCGKVRRDVARRDAGELLSPTAADVPRQRPQLDEAPPVLMKLTTRVLRLAVRAQRRRDVLPRCLGLLGMATRRRVLLRHRLSVSRLIPSDVCGRDGVLVAGRQPEHVADGSAGDVGPERTPARHGLEGEQLGLRLGNDARAVRCSLARLLQPQLCLPHLRLRGTTNRRQMLRYRADFRGGLELCHPDEAL